MLLKYGADARVQDCVGNTPAHVAGLHGHLVLMSTLLQGPRPPDVDTVLNAAGQSILQIANTAMAVSTAAAAGPKLASLSGTREEQHEEEEVDGDEAWAAKLCDHDSDGEDGWGADDGGGWGAGAGSGDGGPETDDAWADRLWAEMQGRRRAASQAASAAFFGGARAQARDDVAIAAAAARATGAARMLELERTKDSAWRARASAGFIGPAPPPGGGGGGGGGAGAAGGGQRQQQQQQSPAFVDHASLRGEYEAKWAALDARAALAGASTAGASASGAVRGGGVAEGDVPWPVPAGCGPSDLAEVLLWGVAGPAELKARLRQEIMRWHPDKFTARFGALLSPGCHGAVLARVKGVSQQVTALMASGGRVQ